ncbi:glutamine--fructose-6-phosphate transaminase (isomerizing) [Acetilactobacillus jinshanensis]|uniref:Glutamine--fructose-6-phosphate aminotransferase [isomerizing] n=1 Tax=Acetilactobacillus jinshanensis TaxID=1720083 RepID=A0A4P6ZM46_9LACO|nr:glutamine--fructose-6-phosphate transaminase (isomerizing) [Acetilactobacillus jinshanensis]QBP18788.1 glutamine--fructose-6-phosphate transaminase (isomerizing) [Acetilactobacillus jinshanensis]URL61659.1 glutamine--fructose-6-phosphate transaminase (isomerizing) [uncultured bacterium]
MCGIVGVTGNKNAVNILVHGLQKLEYRGYDSAGIYVTSDKGPDHLVKRTGTIDNLKKALTPEIKGTAGIGHTRWATNGVVNRANAHPQFSQDDRFYLVHNGVIENYKELRAKYLKGVKFTSQTDTEVVVQLVDHFVVKDGMTTKQAFLKTLGLVGQGSGYAFLLMDREEPDTLYLAKNKNPLLIGVGKDCNVVCSDSLAMLNVTHNFLELHDGEMVVVKPHSIHIQDKNGNPVHRKPFHINMDDKDTGKGPYPYYMLKEVNEQPNIMRKLTTLYLDAKGKPKIDHKLLDKMNQADRLYIIGAGTSYHAGLVGKNLFEKLVHIPTEVHVSSEFAYADPILSKHPFFIFLTQSGETADSRVVLTNVNKMHYPSLTITNVDHSTLSREADYTLLLHAGPEVSVASTKAYTSQIAVEAVLAKALGEVKGRQIAVDFNLRHQLSLVATGMQSVIDQHAKINQMAKKYFVKSYNAFYLGRGTDFYVALEAALKLKEISYIQAEGFASGELKHGPIALIQKNTPVVGIITQKKTAALSRSNLEETASRGAKTFTIVRRALAKPGDSFILPDVDEMLTPLLSVIPAQLLAYYTSLNKGLNVDQPRNLAKSVTVE